MESTPFVVSRFINRNGVISWRVSGWLHGVRIRRNFGSREEAASEKASLELKVLQEASGLRSLTTFLTTEQLREAEAAVTRLKGSPHSLTTLLDFALEHYRAPAPARSVCSSIAGYLDVKRRETERGVLSAIQYTTIRRQLNVLQAHFPDATLDQLTAASLTAFFDRGNPSLKTYNNRRGVLSTFMKFAHQQGWVAANPVTGICFHRISHRRGSAKTLTADRARELMAHVETLHGGQLVPFFALCLFAGIRPCLRTGEILKLKPSQINLDTSVIHIEPEVSKVRMKRNVSIQSNLAAWLAAYPLERFPIIFPNLQRWRAKVAKQFGLSHDIMRHTFISMFVAKFRSMGEAALQAGNSETIIRKHYLDLKDADEAERFFGIYPAKGATAETQPPGEPEPVAFPGTAPALRRTG